MKIVLLCVVEKFYHHLDTTDTDFEKSVSDITMV